MGAMLTVLCLMFLRLRERAPTGPQIPIRSRLLQAALPLALADDLKSGINTVENLMVPKRLSLNTATDNPLAAFGLVSGMVFPVMMFPAAILFGLTELLIPELARCNAAGQSSRIRYLVSKGLRVALIYGLFICGILFLLSDWLCQRLYQNLDAAKFLRWYALLVPMLYCDILIDAMTKGLGQQKICVRYNILTSVLDVIFLYLLLPGYGMEGYFLSFFVTHLLNFCLSLRRLMKITGQAIPFHIPVFSAASTVFALSMASVIPSPPVRTGAYLLLLGSSLLLTRVLTGRDLHWIRHLIRKKDLTKL